MSFPFLSRDPTKEKNARVKEVPEFAGAPYENSPVLNLKDHKDKTYRAVLFPSSTVRKLLSVYDKLIRVTSSVGVADCS